MHEAKKKPRLQDMLMLTDKGYKDLKGAIGACPLTNFSMMLPAVVLLQAIL